MNEYKNIWCNTHNRWYYDCKVKRLGGIMIPCEPVDVTGVLDIDVPQEQERLVVIQEVGDHEH